jgi:hypothetical protein
MPRTHPVFHVSLLEPYHANEIKGRILPPPAPVEIEGEDEYEVESILDSRIRYRKLQYLVKWVGYDDLDWHPHSDITHCAELLEEFHNRHPSKPRPHVALGARS